MDARLHEAVVNNACWCDLVCRSHGLATSLGERLWIAPQGSPPLYPDAITLVRGLAPDDVLREIQDRPGCSVKDSFADVDLSRHGFVELFQARWFFREAANARPGLGWDKVATGSELARWTVAAGLEGILLPELLRDPSVSVPVKQDDNGIAAGAVTNTTGTTVGLSNVFTTRLDARAAWAELPAVIADMVGALSIVGYEHADALAAAMAGGFGPIGPLRVWLKPRSAGVRDATGG
jgi:hypothetical protein